MIRSFLSILLLIFAVFFMLDLFSQNSDEPNLRGEFTQRNVPSIIKTFNEHELKFQHYYSGRPFRGEFILYSIRPARTIESPKRTGFLIELRRGGPLPSLYLMGRVDCIVTDQSSYREIASWNPGNAWTGRLIVSRGVIVSASATHLKLSNQVIRAVGGMPDEIAKRSDIKCDENKENFWVVENQIID